jgi:hypothetical protein
MGTRADFYVKAGEAFEWLGSIAWDGYPSGINNEILMARDEAEFRAEVDNFLSVRDDATRVSDGWPWPWGTSGATDFSYIFEGGSVAGSCFGGKLFDPNSEEDEDGDHRAIGDEPNFPDMSEFKKVAYGKRSGMTIVGLGQ